MRSRAVMTTAAGTSTWLIRLPAVNAPAARMAETAVARVVRRSWARAHRLVAGSSMRPSSAVPKASAPIRCSSGFQRSAAATAGTARAASCSAGDPRAFRAVEQNTRPDTSAGCRRYSSWATRPPMEYPTAANPPISRTRPARRYRPRSPPTGTATAAGSRRHGRAGRRRRPGNDARVSPASGPGGGSIAAVVGGTLDDPPKPDIGSTTVASGEAITSSGVGRFGPVLTLVRPG